MRPLSPEQRQRLIAIGLATLAMVAALYFGLIRMQLQSRAVRAKKITEAQDKVNEANRLIHLATKFEQELAAKKALLEAAETKMASGGDLYSWMIRTVNNFKMAYQVEIPNYSTIRVGEVGAFPNFPYSAAFCTVNGRAFYHDLGKFIADFENHFPHLRIQNLELSTAGGPVNAEDQEKLEFKMEIVALISKPLTGH